MKKLKVYSWQDFSRRFGTRHGQVRRCCAATSKAEVGRIMDKKPHQLFNLTITGNKLEVAACLANPGVVFEKSIDDYNNPPVMMVKDV